MSKKGFETTFFAPFRTSQCGRESMIEGSRIETDGVKKKKIPRLRAAFYDLQK